LPAALVIRVAEIVVPLRVVAEGGVVDVRRQRQRGAATPTADQLCGEQFPFFVGMPVRPEESIEGAHARLILAEADVSAIAAEDVRLRHRQWNAGFTRISENELARLDRASRAGQRLDAATLDRRLIDAVLVAQRIEIAWLRPEVLTGHHADAREALVLFAS